MKLLHVIPRFLGGGPERHLLAMAAAWRNAGLTTDHQVAVLDPPISAPLLLRARKLGIKLLPAPNLHTLRAAIEAADLVEVTYWNHPRLLDLLREDLPPARLLIRCAISGSSRPQVLVRELGLLADALVISSPASGPTAAVQAARQANCPVVFIPSLADMTRLEGFLHREHQGVRVGYLGLVDPTKMHPRFAELCSAVRSPEVRFEVYGDGAWGPELKRRFTALGAGERVRFHGHVEDLNTAFSELDVFGYPLAEDTYATSEKSIQEAMWAGIPPVVLATNGTAALIQTDQTGIVCDSEADYARAIDRLAMDAPLRRRLGAAARNFAHENFDPVRNSARLRDLFESTAALPRRRPTPWPGRNRPAAYKFVLSLGDLAGPFAISLEGFSASTPQAVADADQTIANSSAVLAQGEGGVIHYRNTYPESPHLRYWSGLIARHAGKHDSAGQEFQAAVQLGLDPAQIPAPLIPRDQVNA